MILSHIFLITIYGPMHNLFLKLFLVFAVSFLGLFFGSDASAANFSDDQRVFVVLNPSNERNLNTFSSELFSDIEGSASVVLPDRVVIGYVDDAGFSVLAAHPEVQFVSRELVDVNQFSGTVQLYAESWNTLLQDSFGSAESHQNTPARLENDIFIPDSKNELFPSAGGPGFSFSAPHGAGYYDTSEYMIGSVSVGLILTESNGAIDANTEDWTSGEESHVIAEAVGGLNWWVARNNELFSTPLTFTLNVFTGVPTSYEPISRSGNGLVNLWGPEALANLGFTTTQGGANKFYYRAYQLINDMRDGDDTDWGFLAFVADDSNDANNMFSDGTFAFALLGGPATQLTYGNDGWGPSRFDEVFAHEIAHIFYANDQYFSAARDCTNRTGYFYIENQNSEYNKNGGGCALDQHSLMRSESAIPLSNERLDVYAQEQIGWKDSDGDGYPDVVDQDPKLDVVSNNSNVTNSPTISGSISLGTAKNINEYTIGAVHGIFNFPRHDISVDRFSSAYYQLDNGEKKPLSVTSDGEIDFNISFSNITDGSHNLNFYLETAMMPGVRVMTYQFDVGVVQRLIVAASGTGQQPFVRTFGYLGDQRSEFLAYAETYRGGVEVATGDLDGDGRDEIITGTKDGGGPHIRVFDQQGNLKFGSGFFAYSKNFRGGVRVGAGDLDGDGVDEIIAGAGDGGGPHVRVFDARGNLKFSPGFFAYTPDFGGGVYVSAGDVNNDGKDEIITGPGNGGGPQVRVFTRFGESIDQFFAYAENFRGGVLVDAHDLDGDGVAEIIAGSGFTGGPQVRTFRSDGSLIFTPGFFAYNDSFRGGVFVSGYDLNADGRSEIITGTGFSGGPHIRIFTRYGVPYLTPGFFAENDSLRSGIAVSAGLF